MTRIAFTRRPFTMTSGFAGRAEAQEPSLRRFPPNRSDQGLWQHR